MSDQNDQRMKRRVIIAMMLAILLVLALVFCHRKPGKPAPVRPEPATPVEVKQIIPPPPPPKPEPPPPPPPPKPEPPPPPPPPPKPEPPPPPKVDPVIRFSMPVQARVLAATATTLDGRPVEMVGGTTILGQDRVVCNVRLLINGQPVDYHFRLCKPARHVVWDIGWDDALRPRLTVDAGSGRKALPGLRIERQFFWTQRGIP